MKNSKKNQIRIIGGEWRSRQITFAEIPGLRPTPNRVRETLFNWLQHDIPGSLCLDLFAGSGALGFEAASRGAKAVVSVEQDANACRALHENSVALKAGQIKIVQSDAFRFLATTTQDTFDIVFLDPPFGLDHTVKTCHLLEDRGWLSKQGKIYIEAESGNDCLEKLPANWRLMKSKTAGEVSYSLFIRNGETNPASN
jgi:16S rRNA (guanine966-N2)-methyltransferase